MTPEESQRPGQRIEPTADRLARIRLGEVSEPGNHELALLVAELGPTGAVRALSSGSSGSSGSTALARVARRLDVVPDTSVAQWQAARRSGARFVCPGDGEWPAQLDDLAHVPPHDGAGGPPLGLWVRGACSLADRQPAVAVVGSRAATDYGLYVAGELGSGLAEAGVRVVSGAAYGIDGAAHRGALAVSGATLAVLASGVDVPYPRSNAGLLDDIVRSGGLVISEAPLGSRPTRTRFLVRNRLIAALSAGTVVVEAATRSGALNTAAWSDACSRQTMAVPGPVTSALSGGTHGLVRDRGATLVTCAAHVLAAIGGLDPTAPDPGGDADRAARRRPRDELTLTAAAVLDALPGRGERGVSRLCGDTGLSLPTVLATLAELDVAGFVERGPAGWRLSAAERARIRAEAAGRRAGAEQTGG